MLLVRDAIYEIAEGAGKCPDVTEETLRFANRIERILITEFGADARDTISVPVFGGCVTLPEFVEAPIRALWNGRKADLVAAGNRYWHAETRMEFDPTGIAEVIEDLGDGFCTYRDWMGPFPLFAVSERPEDGAEIEFVGRDPLGRRAAITVPIEAASAEASPRHTGTLFTSLDAISKSPTSGYVHIYAYDPSTRGTLWLGLLAPTDTNPNFRRMRVHNREDGMLDMLVELRHIPHVSGSEVYLIRSREAIYHMAHALTAEGDDAGAYERSKNRALSAMRKEQRRRRPGVPKAKAKTFPQLVRNPFRNRFR